MNKSQFERGDWVTVTNGPEKGAAGKIKRVDQKKREVLVEIDQGLVLNTYKTHRMSWNYVKPYDDKDHVLSQDELDEAIKKLHLLDEAIKNCT